MPVFPARRGYPNLLVLEADPLLGTYGHSAPVSQVYADLFNLPTWQAQRFLDVLNRQLLLSDVAADAELVNGFKVLSPEAQFVAKMAALLDRPDSLHGDKDRREMWKLANLPKGLDFDKVAQILSGSSHSLAQQLALIEEAFQLLEETDTLNKRGLGQLRKLRALALDSVRNLGERGLPGHGS